MKEIIPEMIQLMVDTDEKGEEGEEGEGLYLYLQRYMGITSFTMFSTCTIDDLPPSTAPMYLLVFVYRRLRFF